MKHLINAGWYKDDKKKIRIDPDFGSTAVRFVMDALNPFNRDSSLSGKLITNRRGIKSAYSNIPLKIMVKYARIENILIRDKLDARADRTLATDPALQALEKDINRYIGSKGKTGSKPEDWLDIRSAAKHHPNIKTIRNEHLHMSSRFATPVKEFGYTPRLVKNLRRRFYYEG